MAEEIIIDCGTGEVTVQPDTFLAGKPAPTVDPVAVNAVNVVVQALATIPSSDPGYNVARTVLGHLQAAGL